MKITIEKLEEAMEDAAGRIITIDPDGTITFDADERDRALAELRDQVKNLTDENDTLNRAIDVAVVRVIHHGFDPAPVGRLAALAGCIDLLAHERDTAREAPYAWRLLEGLRREGWVVAIHNDYRQGCRAFMFWLFTRGGKCFSGEGMTDREALEAVRKQVDEAKPPGEKGPS